MSSREVLATVLILTGSVIANAAELYARYMAVERSPEGEVAVLRDSVVIVDGDTRIGADAARLNDRIGRAMLWGDVRIENRDGLVEADSVLYLFNERRAELYGVVRVRRDSLDILAPWLEYRAGDRMVRADRGLRLKEAGRGFQISGARGSYRLESGIGEVDSAPVLAWPDAGDSARLTARRLRWNEQGSRADAAGQVRLVSGDAELACDSVVFFVGPDSGLAFGNPRVRDQRGDASGDSLHLWVTDGALRQVDIRGNARGDYRTTDAERILVAGAVIRLVFAAGAMERIEVERLTLGQLVRGGGSQSDGWRQ